MSLNNKRIFISGGAGVIGKVLVSKLVKENAILWVGDLKKRPRDFPDSVLYRQGDLNLIDYQELTSFQPEIFIHLAASFERTHETYTFWDKNFHDNLKLSHHLITLFKDLSSLETIIFASSYLLYDKNLFTEKNYSNKLFPINESTPIYPRNLTGASKLFHEVELDFLSQFNPNKLKIINARIFRNYGCGSKDIISRWIRQLINYEEITVYNKDNRFDFIYSQDTAEALTQMLIQEIPSGSYNLGTGKSRKIHEVIELLKKFFPNAQISEENSDEAFEFSEADITTISKAIQWTPKFTLETALPQIIEFEKSKPRLELTSKHLLITSISSKIPMVQAIKETITRFDSSIELFGADADFQAQAKHFVDHFWQIPKDEFLTPEHIIDYCKINRIGYLIPSRDDELEFYAKNRESFEKNGISIMVASVKTLEKCLNKKKFAQISYAQQNAKTIPTFASINSVDSERCVVKESRGSGSRNIGIDLNLAEAENWGLNLQNPIFQPFIKGKEFSADVYGDKYGKVKGIILRWREKVVNGESHISTTFQNDIIENEVKHLAEYLEINGHAVIQGIVDDHECIHFIEVNCRFGGASVLSLHSGLDSFYWFLLESTGENLKHYPFNRLHHKRLIRYYNDKIVNVS